MVLFGSAFRLQVRRHGVDLAYAPALSAAKVATGDAEVNTEKFILTKAPYSPARPTRRPPAYETRTCPCPIGRAGCTGRPWKASMTRTLCPWSARTTVPFLRADDAAEDVRLEL